MAANGVDPQREDSSRISGVTWIDNVRKSLRLYVTKSVPGMNQLIVHSLLGFLSLINFTI